LSASSSSSHLISLPPFLMRGVRGAGPAAGVGRRSGRSWHTDLGAGRQRRTEWRGLKPRSRRSSSGAVGGGPGDGGAVGPRGGVRRLRPRHAGWSRKREELKFRSPRRSSPPAPALMKQEEVLGGGPGRGAWRRPLLSLVAASSLVNRAWARSSAAESSSGGLLSGGIELGQHPWSM
jgi:hypothetical protein